MRRTLFVVIFESDTRAGRAFDVALIVAILPTYLACFFPGLRALMDVRLLRVLRVFQILIGFLPWEASSRK